MNGNTWLAGAACGGIFLALIALLGSIAQTISGALG